jgi:hypothetical protein
MLSMALGRRPGPGVGLFGALLFPDQVFLTK